mmetsp:Transcript_31470/g.62740  ORF Transcript_31470/g.62740 Transcript_31470/m.62740 type:complete len:85 (+) Transcript_31470:214-468(+)
MIMARCNEGLLSPPTQSMDWKPQTGPPLAKIFDEEIIWVVVVSFGWGGMDGRRNGSGMEPVFGLGGDIRDKMLVRDDSDGFIFM